MIIDRTECQRYIPVDCEAEGEVVVEDGGHSNWSLSLSTTNSESIFPNFPSLMLYTENPLMLWGTLLGRRGVYSTTTS